MNRQGRNSWGRCSGGTSRGTRNGCKIIYLSNTSDHLHPGNTSSEFHTTLDHNMLMNIPPQLTTAATITFLTVTLPTNYDVGETLFAIKSNLCSRPVIRSSFYDGVLALFSHLDWYYSEDDRTVTIKFDVPFYFTTTMANLMDIHFSLVDIYTNSPLNIPASESPTMIGLKIMSEDSACVRKQPFNILLESRDAHSKIHHPTNCDSSFRICLPTRLDFPGQWAVVMKTLHMSNRIWNITDSTGFWLEIERYHYVTFGGEAGEEEEEEEEEGMEMTIAVDDTIERRLTLLSGYYADVSEILTVINTACSTRGIPIQLQIVNVTSLEFKYVGEKKSEVMSSLGSEVGRDDTVEILPFATMKISPKLACLLGFSRKVRDTEMEHNFFPDKNWRKKGFKADYPPNIWVFHPKQICVQCDIVDSTVIGHRHIKALQCMSIVEEKEEKIMSFTFPNDDEIDLAISSFDTIEIRLTDLADKDLQMDVSGIDVDEEDSMGTFVQLTFVNIDKKK